LRSPPQNATVESHINCRKENEMNTQQMHQEIRATNLAYMGIVQKLIRADRERAVAQLGVTEELAELVTGLSAQQIAKMSGVNLLLCCFRLDEQVLMGMLSDHGVAAAKPAVRANKKVLAAVAA
jgi:flagellar transcriptional activator FlhD